MAVYKVRPKERSFNSRLEEVFEPNSILFLFILFYSILFLFILWLKLLHVS